MKEKIHYTKPSITTLELEYAADAALNGWGENCYGYINRFENLFRDYLGVKYSIATSSCTGALHMGMAALGIGPEDEVILADTNWIATAAPIVYLGAKPIFVDILSNSWCINPELVEKSITKKTKAIIVTHLYGNLCEMDSLIEISAKYGVPIIEDSAEAIGSVYYGKKAGSMGKFGVFSFHGTKTLTTGEGGMFVTNDMLLYQKVLALSNHGRMIGEKRQFWPTSVGFKYKISNIQAAIGCAQLERIDELVIRKKEILNFYKSNLADLNGVSMNPEPEFTINGSWMPTVVFAPHTEVTREKLQSAFHAENIDARVFFWPLSSLEMFVSVPQNYNSWSIPSRAINLPSYVELSELDQLRIINVVRSFF